MCTGGIPTVRLAAAFAFVSALGDDGLNGGTYIYKEVGSPSNRFPVYRNTILFISLDERLNSSTTCYDPPHFCLRATSTTTSKGLRSKSKWHTIILTTPEDGPPLQWRVILRPDLRSMARR